MGNAIIQAVEVHSPVVAGGIEFPLPSEEDIKAMKSQYSDLFEWEEFMLQVERAPVPSKISFSDLKENEKENESGSRVEINQNDPMREEILEFLSEPKEVTFTLPLLLKILPQWQRVFSPRYVVLTVFFTDWSNRIRELSHHKFFLFFSLPFYFFLYLAPISVGTQ